MNGPTSEPLEHEHTTAAIRKRIGNAGRGGLLRDWVLGGIDGAVTTFAIVAGVAGAGLAPSVVLILGCANLIADGFSMAAGNYSGVKAENDERSRLRAMELRHIRQVPEGERAEVREIFRRKGFEGPDLDRAVEVISSDNDRWAAFMLTEELGLSPVARSAPTAALATFTAFLICGAVPLLPFALGFSRSFTVAAFATAAVFFLIGAAKARWSLRAWWVSGLETLAIGSLAAGAAFLVGDVLEKLVR
ncbi:hypothetical protein HK107_14600 [Parvularcula sp. ZS-1/3]|uniref:VIT family protein n=1 Tax=Parvularcula mediterranea TaxID=2732508 RepID=A0A7Y3W6H7_9PROT|nr:VIT1/CCC1 transporter family protein [Parvularcula mediterranea]NNU17558.1 hypothetical protein [Parvularcula mediterranea]